MSGNWTGCRPENAPVGIKEMCELDQCNERNARNGKKLAEIVVESGIKRTDGSLIIPT